jgi:hypothetical protein
MKQDGMFILMAPFSLVGGYQHFTETYYLLAEVSSTRLYPENGGTMFLGNNGNDLPGFTVA